MQVAVWALLLQEKCSLIAHLIWFSLLHAMSIVPFWQKHVKKLSWFMTVLIHFYICHLVRHLYWNERANFLMKQETDSNLGNIEDSLLLICSSFIIFSSLNATTIGLAVSTPKWWNCTVRRVSIALVMSCVIYILSILFWRTNVKFENICRSIIYNY